MKQARHPTLLVTGSSGRLGRRVVELLLEAGVERGRLIAGTRTPEKIADLQARGAITRHVDFDHPEGLPQAFDGADRILIISTNTLAPVGRRVDQHRAAIQAAAARGVDHIFYTSLARAASDSPEESPLSLCLDHASSERLLRDCGVPYTALRNSFYADSMMRRIPELLRTGVVHGFEGSSGISWIPREDCARVAAAALVHVDPPPGAIEVTGTEVLDGARLAALLTDVSGKPVRFVPRTPKDLVADFMAMGIPIERAAVLVGMEAAMASGFFDVVTDAVERLTGRGPTTLRDFLAAQLAAA